MNETMQAGDRMGGYEILRPLAAGGMAEVFVARSPVGRPVALKRIRADLASDSNFVELFLREARIAITLDHPDIAQVLDVGEMDGSYFLVMELVEGISLLALDRAAAAQGQRIPLPVIVWIVQRIARALHHAHDRREEDGTPRGIIHRDVSPQNILLSEAGGVKLIDFGVARATNTATLTRPGVTRGKYLYFSPEQIKMQPLDGRSDLFALGGVLYEVLLGRRAFDGELIEVLRAITHGEFVDPLERDPELPGELADVCQRALRIKREARWATGEEMAHALESWAHTAAPSINDAVIREYLAHAASDELSESVGHPVSPRPFPAELLPWARPLLEGESPQLETPALPRAELTTAASPITRFESTLRSALVPLLILGVTAVGFGLWWLVQPPKTTGYAGHRPAPKVSAPAVARAPALAEPEPEPEPEQRNLLPERPADGSARLSEAQASGWILLRFELSDALIDLSTVEPYVSEDPGQVGIEGAITTGGDWVETTKLLLVAETDAGLSPPRFVTVPGFEVGAKVHTLRFLLLNPTSFGTRRFVYPQGDFRLRRPTKGAPLIRVGPRQITDPWTHRLPYVRIDSNWTYHLVPRIAVIGEEERGDRPKALFVWVGTPIDLVQWGSRSKAGLTGDDLWGIVEEGERLELDGIGAVWMALAGAPPEIPTDPGAAQFLIEVKQVGASKLLERRKRKLRRRRSRR